MPIPPRIKLGFAVSPDNISESLTPLIQETIGCYQDCHEDLKAVYVIGSVALGELQEGISDLDTVGITAVPADHVAKEEELPTVDDMTYGRTHRVELLMQKYRSGNLIEPFRRDQRLLTRSCAKAAMRVVSGITILRGADYYSSPYETSRLVPLYAPEAEMLTDEAMQMIYNPNETVELSMRTADRAVSLFRRLSGER